MGHWTFWTEKQLSNRYVEVKDIAGQEKDDFVLTVLQLQLQTAPVLLLFPPTTGPHGKPDQQALRFDFGTGYVTTIPNISVCTG